ncbi:hypothetical protein BDZ89DRAFT_1060967 [Hymenopellis radicata]|nr:hypothetical protein BDZ89DRAFT_1060967 [Hymenopellis radicata]
MSSNSTEITRGRTPTGFMPVFQLLYGSPGLPENRIQAYSTVDQGVEEEIAQSVI